MYTAVYTIVYTVANIAHTARTTPYSRTLRTGLPYRKKMRSAILLILKVRTVNRLVLCQKNPCQSGVLNMSLILCAVGS